MLLRTTSAASWPRTIPLAFTSSWSRTGWIPPITARHLPSGRFYFDQKDYANSAKWLKKLNPDDPHYLESLFFFGVDEYFLGHYPSSETAFEKIGKEIPLSEVANNAGVLAARGGGMRKPWMTLSGPIRAIRPMRIIVLTAASPSGTSAGTMPAANRWRRRSG